MRAIKLPPFQVLHVREVPECIESLKTPAPGTSPGLFGIEVRVAKSLPETVKDKDGNDVELIGVLCIGDFFPDMLSDSPSSVQQIVMLTGDIVKVNAKIKCTQDSTGE